MIDIDTIPHVKFKGCHIYMVDNKVAVIKAKGTHWTVSQLQLVFKCGYNQAMLLIDYCQSIGVLGLMSTRYGTTVWDVL